VKALKEAHAEVDCISVPGSLEIPTAIAIAADAARRRRRPYDGAVALGCVIRGETIHFEIVSHQSARGLMELSVARGLPIGNGIITVENEAQAFARAASAAIAIAVGISSEPGTLMQSTSACASFSAFTAPASSASAIAS
jgi:6,7-dimethyl-8-ribityllumazine synthase